MALPTLVVEIDFDDDGDYGDANEDVTADVEALRITTGRESPLGVGKVASAELVLKNDDKKYSPEYTSGPLYGNLKPKRKVQIRTTAPTAQTLFVGRVDNIIVEPGLDRRLARINCLDDTAFLLREIGPVYSLATAGINMEPDANGQGPFTGEAIGELLDEVGWPAGGRTLDSGVSEMDTWYLGGDDGLSGLSALVDEELGLAYVGKDGKLIFEDRSHRHLGAHLTAQAVYTDNPTGALRYDKFDPYDLGIENIFNKAAVTTAPRLAPANETFEMGIPEDSGGHAIPPQLAPGEVRTFTITWDNIASSFVSFSKTANTRPDGSGIDISAFISTLGGTLRATRMDIRLTNGHSQTAYITALSATVKTRAADAQGTEMEAEDSGSQDDYGLRRLGVSPAFMAKTDAVRDWAAIAVETFKEPIPMARIEFGPYDNTILTEVLTRKVSDRVGLANDEAGVDSHFFIEGISYELVAGRDGSKEWRTGMVLSKRLDGSGFWILDNSAYNRLDIGTKLFG